MLCMLCNRLCGIGMGYGLTANYIERPHIGYIGFGRWPLAFVWAFFFAQKTNAGLRRVRVAAGGAQCAGSAHFFVLLAYF
jgi:hypothetical protein